MDRNHSKSIWDRDFDLEDPTPEDAWARAREKLAAIRSGSVPAKPAGLFVGRVVGGLFCLLVAGVILTGIGALLTDRDESTQIIAILLGIPAILMLIPAYRLLTGSRANTPWRALNLYYRSLGGGKYSQARKLVAPNDFDHFPRFFPDVPKVKGFPARDPSQFREPLDYRDYWRQLIRWPTAPYCIARVQGLKVQEVAPDVVHCEYTLSISVNTSLWTLLIFVPPGLIFALIVDAITRTNIKTPMSKNLVRVENEWILLNGAWLEDDDRIPDWI